MGWGSAEPCHRLKNNLKSAVLGEKLIYKGDCGEPVWPSGKALGW